MSRKKTGKYIPNALTSSKKKNQTLRRTRVKNSKLKLDVKLKPRKTLDTDC